MKGQTKHVAANVFGAALFHELKSDGSPLHVIGRLHHRSSRPPSIASMYPPRALHRPPTASAPTLIIGPRPRTVSVPRRARTGAVTHQLTFVLRGRAPPSGGPQRRKEPLERVLLARAATAPGAAACTCVVGTRLPSSATCRSA